MSETKFTKGDWSVVDSKVVVCDGFKVAYAYSGSNIPLVSEINANAHLIAAAPEMYDYLLHMVEHDVINDSSIEREVKSLLAKTRGENATNN